MRILLFVQALLTASLAFAEECTTCLTFDENHTITLRGMIVQSATTEESEGEPPHKYMAIVLDNPICWTKDKLNKITVMAVHPVSIKWLGHYVHTTGLMMAGDSWWFNVQSIKDVDGR